VLSTVHAGGEQGWKSADLFAHVYTRPTAALEQQQAALLREMQGAAP